MWIVEREHRRDEDGNNVAIELRDDDGSMQANVRWDGCMQIWTSGITEEQNPIRDTFHTCDIRALIEKLQRLHTTSQALFDHEGYWADEVHPPEDDLAYLPDDTARGGASPPP